MRFRVSPPLRLDLEDERLWHGSAPVRLNHKAFLVLRALMDRPGVLVSKDELFQAGWPGLAVSEAVLTTAIKELRQALGDSARAPRWIETVHGRGYRFLAPVEQADAPAGPAPARPAGLAVAGGRPADRAAPGGPPQPSAGPSLPAAPVYPWVAAEAQAPAPGPAGPPATPLQATAAPPAAAPPAAAPPAAAPPAPAVPAAAQGRADVPATQAGGTAPSPAGRRRGPSPAMRFALAAAVIALALSIWAVIASREPREPVAAAAEAPAGAPVAGASDGLAPAIDRSIAILPFADLSPVGEAWFAAGLTEEIVASLSRAPDLRVASRAAAARFGPDADPRASGRALGVAHVVTGSVRRADGRVRVTAQLVRTADGFQLWAQTYDRPAAESIAIQQDIAFAIARALRSVMEPGRLRAMLAAGTRSVEAHEAYLRGLALDQAQLRDGDVALSAAAGEAFETARRLDPEFSAAHWEAAQGWVGRATRLDNSARGEGLDERTRLARYLERVDAAIATATDPTTRLRYSAARARAQLKPREAFDLISTYVAQRPNDIDGWEQLADIAALAGRRDAIARAAERVHSLSMAEGAPRSRAITLTVMVPDLPTAVARARAQLALRPDHAVTLYQAHRALAQAGLAAEAAALIPPILASDLPSDTRAMAELRQACVEGRTADARLKLELVEREGDRGTIWQARQVLGDPRANETLEALDVDPSIGTLSEFLIHPTFEVRAYPQLMARLAREGVSPPRAVPMPGRCPAS